MEGSRILNAWVEMGWGVRSTHGAGWLSAGPACHGLFIANDSLGCIDEVTSSERLAELQTSVLGIDDEARIAAVRAASWIVRLDVVAACESVRVVLQYYCVGGVETQ